MRFDSGEAHALALAGKGSVLLWVRADLHDATTLRQAWLDATGGTDPSRPWQPTYPAIEAGRVHMNGLALADGRVQVRWFDAGSGDAVASTESRVRAGALELTCPTFGRDLAAIVRRT